MEIGYYRIKESRTDLARTDQADEGRITVRPVRRDSASARMVACYTRNERASEALRYL